MDGLFTCHVLDWKRIPSNRIGGKLFPIDLTMLKVEINAKYFEK